MAAVGANLSLFIAAFWLLVGVADARANDLPLHSQAEVEAYLSSHVDSLQDQLQDYNRQHNLVRGVTTGSTKVLSSFWDLQRLEGERVFLIARYVAGQADWDARKGRLLFEFRWQDGGLRLIAHGRPPAKQAGVTDDDIGQSCVDNYFSNRPCLDTVKRWTDFTEIYGLPKDRESAAIFQAFAQADTRTGERLLASALGEPPPVTESIYPMQAEVDALNLSRYQRDMGNPCDLDAHGIRPCPEVRHVYRAFIQRHGLPDAPATAGMFAAYAAGDFRRGDTLYAVAKDLPRPNYEDPTTAIGRDVALAGLRAPAGAEGGGCQLNPYDARPCPQAIQAWQRFRESYQLSDSIESARIFEAYTSGDFTAGDQLFAEAKGVSVVELLKAAGVPSDRLIIEVYPGQRP